jgi:hypothetical protein
MQTRLCSAAWNRPVRASNVSRPSFRAAIRSTPRRGGTVAEPSPPPGPRHARAHPPGAGSGNCAGHDSATAGAQHRVRTALGVRGCERWPAVPFRPRLASMPAMGVVRFPCPHCRVTQRGLCPQPNGRQHPNRGRGWSHVVARAGDAERRSRISFDALHHDWALLPVHPRSRRAIASCSGPLNPSSARCGPFGRTAGQVAFRQNRVAFATWWVSVGRTVGSALPVAPEPVAARHLGVLRKLHEIKAIAVGTRFASRLGGWRECA